MCKSTITLSSGMSVTVAVSFIERDEWQDDGVDHVQYVCQVKVGSASDRVYTERSGRPLKGSNGLGDWMGAELERVVEGVRALHGEKDADDIIGTICALAGEAIKAR